MEENEEKNIVNQDNASDMEVNNEKEKNTFTLAEVEDIYRPYKQKKKTRATVAKAKGLEPLSIIIYSQEETEDINKIAEKYIKISLCF